MKDLAEIHEALDAIFGDLDKHSQAAKGGTPEEEHLANAAYNVHCAIKDLEKIRDQEGN